MDFNFLFIGYSRNIKFLTPSCLLFCNTRSVDKFTQGYSINKNKLHKVILVKSRVLSLLNILP